MAPVFLDHLPPLASPLGFALVAVAGFVLLYLIERYVLAVPYPQGIPIVGQSAGSRRLSLRTRLRYYTDCESLFREAYDNYVKKGKPVILPGFGFRKEVIMPQSAMKWVLAQPDDVLSVDAAFVEVDQVKWGLGHEKIVADAWQAMLVKKELNQVLEAICAAMNNELGLVFDEHFGTDTANWKEIDLGPTIQIIVAQAASRFTVGLPLCRDKGYIRNALKINEWLIINAGVTGGTPRILQPIVGFLLNIPTRRLLSEMKKWFVPLWEKRLELLPVDPQSPGHEEPQDHLQLILRYAQRERQHELHDFPLILRRLAATNFGSMHQTKIQVTNVILNVLGSDAEYNTIAVLRDEVDRILGDDKNAAWTKAKVSQMTRADSVSRETLRLQSFGGRAIFRKVMTSNFETPDGYHLPKGTLLSFLSQPAHVDHDKMDDAAKYDPFRFSRLRELAESRNEKIAPVSLVSTSPEFLPFGHGKHACPGRFLIDFELKMILAYVLRNYDIAFADELNGKRPPNIWLTEAMLPPNGVKIRVKRRERNT
ncbi:cytochrome P450 [Ilyonectria robusta]|uniref:cytochrome P450 n=1 Tax=Ilyonectria robusta TaxID=1079257 RepID=UPI001E8CFD2B|nr:cytochrome P450 [Ilyonectria robusta]KAH8686213.1 cytochrome P450 [Ilyonectria robusta]